MRYPAYELPKVWTWNKPSGGTSQVSAGRCRPCPGRNCRCRHPLQLFPRRTERPEGHDHAGGAALYRHPGSEYDAWLITIGEGDQFGSGFVTVNPNSKIPALMDRSGSKPVRVFEFGSILVYLAEKFSAFFPAEQPARAECLSWLFWQMGRAHPFSAAALATVICVAEGPHEARVALIAGVVSDDVDRGRRGRQSECSLPYPEIPKNSHRRAAEYFGETGHENRPNSAPRCAPNSKWYVPR